MATKREGYRTVPRRLPDQLRLAELVLDGMAKHHKDADYPAILDSLGVEAAHDRAFQTHTQAAATKMVARKAAGEARAEETQFFVFLEKVQADVEAAYGKRSPRLYDYGFRPPAVRVVHRKPKAARKSKKSPAGTAAGAAGAGGTTAPSSTAGASAGATDGTPTSGASGAPAHS